MRLFLFIAVLCCSPITFALTLQMPKLGDSVVGDIKTVYVEPGDSLIRIGRRYGVGYKEMRSANPNVRAGRLRPWEKIIVPAAYVLPDAPREGIVINLAEMRLYYYPENKSTVFTAPMGIGKQGWSTPVMKTTIIEKIAGPEWRPPKSIKEEAALRGKILPDVVPAGPNNPLGEYALRLGSRSYLIHGTNSPWSIGKRSSHGCMRMWAADVEELFQQVPVGTPVHIVHQPVKVGWYQGELYIESHEALSDVKQKSHGAVMKKAIGERPVKVDQDTATAVITEQVGYPQYVGRLE